MACCVGTAGAAAPSAKNGCCCAAEFDEWQRVQFAVAAVRTSAYREELAKSAGLSGKLLLPPTSRMAGACNWIVVPPVALAPAQLRIHTVMVSPQAAADCSQQLWPPATLATMRDWSGCVRFTTLLAAW